MFRVNLKETICIINRIYDVYHSGTYPLGHLYSRDTSIQRGHNIWSPKNVDIIFVFVSSGEGTPLFMGKGLFFDSGSQTWIQPLFLVHLSTQKVTNHKKP